MSKKATLDALEKLHAAVAVELTRRIEEEDAKPADIAAAIKFLKDNGIEADLASNPSMARLVDNLPFPTEPSDQPKYN